MTENSSLDPAVKEQFRRLTIPTDKTVDPNTIHHLDLEDRTVTLPGQLHGLLSSMGYQDGVYYLDPWNDFPREQDPSIFREVRFVPLDEISEYDCLNLHPYLSILRDQAFSYYLVRADDPHPENPQVYYIDHDSFEGDATDKRINLADFLSKLRTKTELEHLIAGTNPSVPDSGLLAHLGPEAYRMNKTSLNAGGATIRQLDGIGTCANLRWVELFNNQIADLSPLSNLHQIESLNLRDNAINDLSPLKSLPNLKRLELDKNAIKDITPLQRLTDLEWLRLDQNKIEDIGPLACLKGLTWLILTGNRIREISALAGLTKLTGLYLSENPIQDFSPLSGLVNLETLYLDGTDFEDASLLVGLTNLKSLRIDKNREEQIARLLEDHPHLEIIKRGKPA
jgi:Leucine-rich repeat (LRR) protein